MPIAAQTPDLSSTEIRLALLENGYWPLPVGKGKHPPLKEWQNIHADPGTVIQWASDHPRCLSTGVLTGYVVAVDIDALDPAIAEKLISPARYSRCRSSAMPDG
jgi:hypothetical protein